MRKRENFGTKSVLLGLKVTGKVRFFKGRSFSWRFYPCKRDDDLQWWYRCKSEAELFLWEPWLKSPECVCVCVCVPWWKMLRLETKCELLRWPLKIKPDWMNHVCTYLEKRELCFLDFQHTHDISARQPYKTSCSKHWEYPHQLGADWTCSSLVFDREPRSGMCRPSCWCFDRKSVWLERALKTEHCSVCTSLLVHGPWGEKDRIKASQIDIWLVHQNGDVSSS